MKTEAKVKRLSDALDAITAAGLALEALGRRGGKPVAEEAKAIGRELARLGDRIGALLRRAEGSA